MRQGHSAFGIVGAVVCIAAIVAVLFTARHVLAEEAMTKAQQQAMTEIFAAGQEGGRLFAAGQFAEAEKVFRGVVEKTEAAFPGEGLMRASGIYNLAAALSELGRYDEARTMAEEALDLRRNNRGDPAAIANAQALLAEIVRDMGKDGEALPMMRDAVKSMAANPNADSATLVKSLSEFVGMLADAGRFAEADKAANDLVNALPQLGGGEQVDVYSAVGRLRSAEGRLDEAFSGYRAAYDALGKAAPDDIGRRAVLVSNIASILRQQFRTAEAERLFARAVADLEKLYPDGHPRLATALDGLGLAIAESGRPAEAWPVQRRALEMRMKLLPKEHPLIATSLVNLGLSLLRDGQYKVAAEAFRRAVVRRQKLGDEVGAARAGVNLAIAQHALNDTKGAVKSLEEARAVLDESLPAGHPIATTAAIDEAWLLLALGENGKALAVARQAAAALVAGRELAGDEPDAVPPDEDKRRIVVKVAAAWAVAGGN
jgi:tetratricopeptide (TPR) repeat protein